MKFHKLFRSKKGVPGIYRYLSHLGVGFNQRPNPIIILRFVKGAEHQMFSAPDGTLFFPMLFGFSFLPLWPRQ